MTNVFIVIRREGEYESTESPVRAFKRETEAKAFAQNCTEAFKRQRELFVANRDRYGDKWWELGYEKTDIIERRYERKLPDRGCSIKQCDVWWNIWEVPFTAGKSQ